MDNDSAFGGLLALLLILALIVCLSYAFNAKFPERPRPVQPPPYEWPY